MKTISIKLKTKEKLDQYRSIDGLSYNKAVRKLLESADSIDEVIECKPQYYNLKIDDDLLVKLNNCRLYSNESHSDILSRLLHDLE